MLWYSALLHKALTCYSVFFTPFSTIAWRIKPSSEMRAQHLFPVAAATSVLGEAAKYSLNSAALTANTPFPDAFVSYSIEFASFPDFAGKCIRRLP